MEHNNIGNNPLWYSDQPLQGLQGWTVDLTSQELQHIKTPIIQYNEIDELGYVNLDYESDDNDYCFTDAEENKKSNDEKIYLAGNDVFIHYINIKTDRLTSIRICTKWLDDVEVIYES
jgi:hypothetical protein